MSPHHSNIIPSCLAHSVIISSFQCHPIISNVILSFYCHSVIPFSSHIPPQATQIILIFCHFYHPSHSILIHVIIMAFKSFLSHSIIPMSFRLHFLMNYWACPKVWRKIVQTKVRLGDVTGMKVECLFLSFVGHSESERPLNEEMMLEWQG